MSEKAIWPLFWGAPEKVTCPLFLGMPEMGPVPFSSGVNWSGLSAEWIRVCPMNTVLTRLTLVLAAAASVNAVARQQPAPAAAPPVTAPPALNTDMHYQIGPDSLPREGVPKGEVRGPFTLPSEAYPGTQHTYWVYVPAQYDAKVPASLMILNDGQAFKNMEGDVRAPNVFDNLIYRREIPVMLGVFINPGRRPD